MWMFVNLFEYNQIKIAKGIGMKFGTGVDYGLK